MVVRTFLIYERAYFFGLLHMDIRLAIPPAPRGCEQPAKLPATLMAELLGPSASLVDSSWRIAYLKTREGTSLEGSHIQINKYIYVYI